MTTDLEDLLTQARRKGTDKQFREWVQRQPSCISGRFSEWVEEIGEWRNPACHVRRAGKSGVAHKELYACIPLTHAEHLAQHQHGEGAFPGGKAWFDRQRMRYLRAWIKA